MCACIPTLEDYVIVLQGGRKCPWLLYFQIVPFFYTITAQTKHDMWQSLKLSFLLLNFIEDSVLFCQLSNNEVWYGQ